VNREEIYRLLDLLTDEEYEELYQYMQSLAEKCQKEGEEK
jgi:hypothetical protein